MLFILLPMFLLSSRYDDEADQITSYQKVALTALQKIEIGMCMDEGEKNCVNRSKATVDPVHFTHQIVITE